MGKRKKRQSAKGEKQANKVIMTITAVLLILALLTFFIAT